VVELGAAGGALELGIGVVVIDRPDVEPEVTEALLPAAVEIHLYARTAAEHLAGNVRVPVADIDATGVGVVEAALNRRSEVSLRDAAEAVVAGDRHVAGHRRRRWRGGRGGLRRDERRRAERGGDRQSEDGLTHRVAPC